MPRGAKTLAATGVALIYVMCAKAEETRLAPNECEILKEVVEHTKNDFAPLRGAAITSDKWQVNLSIPAARACYIQRNKRISYSCESEILGDGADVVRARDERLSAISTCLGPIWVKSNIFSEFFVSLSDPDTERAIFIAVEQESPFPQYFLRTDVYRMNQVPLDSAPRSIVAIKPTGYCEDLKYLLNDADKDFTQSIAGMERNEFPYSVHWESNNQLSGWKDCYVHEWNDQKNCRYLTCETDNVTGKDEAELLKASVSNDVLSCLGDGWKESGVRTGDGTLAARLVKPSSPTIELSPTKSLYSAAWKLQLRIGNDSWCSPGK